jgi:hypothetical protein
MDQTTINEINVLVNLAITEIPAILKFFRDLHSATGDLTAQQIIEAVTKADGIADAVKAESLKEAAGG